MKRTLAYKQIFWNNMDFVWITIKLRSRFTRTNQKQDKNDYVTSD